MIAVLLEAAGVGTLLLGVRVVAGGLSLAAPSRAMGWIAAAASNPWRAAIAGALVTAVLHSSSAVSVATLALLEAGVLTLPGALAVVLGANVGTTVTAQAVAFDIAGLGLPAVLAGGATGALVALGWIGAGRREVWMGAAMALAGFGGVLVGLELLTGPVAGRLDWKALLAAGGGDGGGVAAAVIAGRAAALTALVQSSSAVTSLAVALASKGIVSVTEGVAIALGANVGTVTTALVAGLGTGPWARKLALADLAVNLAGVCLALIGLAPFLALVQLLGGEPGRQVANAHTLFNLLSALAVLPLVRPVARWLGG